MAIRIKPYIFSTAGWTVEAQSISGNELRCRSSKVSGRYFVYDIQMGLLASVLKPNVREEVLMTEDETLEAQATHQLSKENEVVKIHTIFGDEITSKRVDSGDDPLHIIEMENWVTCNWEKHEDFREIEGFPAILSRLTNGHLSKDDIYQWSKAMYGEPMNLMKYHGGGWGTPNGEGSWERYLTNYLTRYYQTFVAKPD